MAGLLLHVYGAEKEGISSALRVALNGVRVLACSNSLASAGLAPSDVVAPAEPISSAVGHLTRRQMAGWAYVRL